MHKWIVWSYYLAFQKQEYRLSCGALQEAMVSSHVFMKQYHPTSLLYPPGTAGPELVLTPHRRLLNLLKDEVMS